MEFKNDKFFELYDNKNGVAKYEYNNNIIARVSYKDDEDECQNTKREYDSFGNLSYIKTFYQEHTYHNTYDNGVLIRQEKINNDDNEIERKYIEDSGNKISYCHNDEEPFKVTVKEEFEEPILIRYSTITDSYKNGKIEKEIYHIDDINELTIINNTMPTGIKSETNFKATIKNSNDTVSQYNVDAGYISMNQYDNNGNLVKRVQYEPHEISLVEYDKRNNISLMETILYNDNIEELMESTKCTNIYDDKDRLIQQTRQTVDNENNKDFPSDWYNGTNGSLFKDYNW